MMWGYFVVPTEYTQDTLYFVWNVIINRFLENIGFDLMFVAVT